MSLQAGMMALFLGIMAFALCTCGFAWIRFARKIQVK